MKLFKNIFENLGFTFNVNFKKLVEVRRAKMIKEGFDVSFINWEHYEKVLEAKYKKLNAN